MKSLTQVAVYRIMEKYISKNLAIGIIPLDEDNNTWLVGQYRYAPDSYSWENPNGRRPAEY